MSLTDKYRPKTLEEVLGQDHITSSIGKMFEEGSQQSFLFQGPSGVGKTTLARILADMVGCTELKELDAASNSGVDNMKKLSQSQQYYAINAGARVFIIDECHMLSKSAWNSLLKDIEEPPEGNFWVFCTTEVSKVPRTIRTRCAEMKFKPVGQSDLRKLLRKVNQAEEFGLEDGILEAIAGAVGGSPRQALVMLNQAFTTPSEELSALFGGPIALPSAYNLAQLLSKQSFSLKEAMEIVSSLKGESPEGVRQVVRAYFTTFVLRTPSNSWALKVLSEFTPVAIEQNQVTDIVMRVARLDWHRNR